MVKKQKTLQKKKKKYKSFFKNKDSYFITEKPARDIIERCKLPKAIELREKLGYNHDDIIFVKKHQ